MRTGIEVFPARRRFCPHRKQKEVFNFPGLLLIVFVIHQFKNLTYKIEFWHCIIIFQCRNMNFTPYSVIALCRKMIFECRNVIFECRNMIFACRNMIYACRNMIFACLNMIFIDYQGKDLVSLDIKNSQPYISTILANPNFYNTQST